MMICPPHVDRPLPNDSEPPTTGRRLRLPVLLPALWLAFVLAGCGDAPDAPTDNPRAAALSPVQALQTERAEGFEVASTPRPFIFPQDHGPHPTFRTEWWYFVGNLSDGDGQDFGFQLTFFRHADQPAVPDRASAWASRDLFFAHFALSDIADQQFYAFERFSRGAAGLAGAQAEPFQVWVEDWSVQRQTDGAVDAARDGGRLLPATLRARQEGVALRLELMHSRPPVAVGDDGLSLKSDMPGAASHYYSLSRIASRGEVELNGRTFDVTGDVWLDREWSTSTLTPQQVGWDWFSLQLDDGSELMYYQIRLADGGVEPASHGILVAADGSSQHLALDDVELQVTDTWTSELGITYPSGWRLTVPDQRLDLTIEPRLNDQELRLSVTYWEGAVSFRGTRDGAAVAGPGYVELVGYAQ